MKTQFPFKKFNAIGAVIIVAMMLFILGFFAKIACQEMTGVWLIVFELFLLASLYAPAKTLYYVYGSLKMPNQMIELRDTAIYWHIFPSGTGELPYSQIRNIGLTFNNYRGHISKGRLHITYLPAHQAEDFRHWQTITLNLDYIRYPVRGLSSQSTYLNSIEELQRNLVAQIPAKQLISELEWEKMKTRKWLDGFKECG